MSEINLLKSLPKPKRNISNRNMEKTDNHIKISRQYGKEYFDGDRSFGYGGYKYDGRWVPVAKDIADYYGLIKGSRILDVGCAKGFLVKDLVDLGLEAYGIDISKYAIDNAHKDIKNRLKIGNAKKLPYEDNSFDLVISLNTIHNLDRNECKMAIQEIQRVSKTSSFIQVDSYTNENEKRIFEEWVLTAKFYGYPNEWLELFKESGYTGDWYWTIIK